MMKILQNKQIVTCLMAPISLFLFNKDNIVVGIINDAMILSSLNEV